MRIGVTLGTPKAIGGGFQFEKFGCALISSVKAYFPDHEFVYLIDAKRPLSSISALDTVRLGDTPIEALVSSENRMGLPPIEPFLTPPPERQAPQMGFYSVDQGLQEHLISRGIERLLCLQPNLIGPRSGLPYAAPIWDLMHKHGFDFPEVTANHEVAYRDLMYVNLCAKAKIIFAESDAGRRDILKWYGDYISPEKVFTVDMLPAIYKPGHQMRQRSTPSIEALRLAQTRYFIYPAQMWPHKNHVVLIRAMYELLKKVGPNIKLVFTGTYSDYYMARNFQSLIKEVDSLGLREEIIFLGFVSDYDIEYLYSHAQALLMPSYFGPSNLPPLEAVLYDCPVIVGDCFGMSEFLGASFDRLSLTDHGSWAQKMLDLLNPEFRAKRVILNKSILKIKSWEKSVGQFKNLISHLTSI